MTEATGSGSRPAAPGTLAALLARGSEAGIVEVAHALLGRAIEARASHVHVEPKPGGGVSVPARIDGVLREVAALPPDLFAPVLARLKLMADMPWSHAPEPRQGQIEIWHRGSETSYTVPAAAMPTLHGESLSVHFVPRPRAPWSWGTLGVPFAAALDPLLARGAGLILFASLPGAGKSTALAAALAALDRDRRNVVLVSDATGYRLDGVSQSRAELLARPRSARLPSATSMSWRLIR